MPMPETNQIYDALALPDEALDNGGMEILRVGIIDDELYVTARRAFKDPAKWGDVLADIARRIALLYSAEDTSLTEQEILVSIEEAFAADLGAPVIEDKPEAANARRARSGASGHASSAKSTPNAANAERARHADQHPHARAVAHDGKGQSCQVAQEGRRQDQSRRRDRRNRDRQGDDGIRGGRRRRAGQDRRARRHRPTYRSIN